MCIYIYTHLYVLWLQPWAFDADSKNWPEMVTSRWLSNALLRNFVLIQNKPGWSLLTGFCLWDLWEGHVWGTCSVVGLFALWGKGGSSQKNWVNRFWYSFEGSLAFQLEIWTNTRTRYSGCIVYSRLRGNNNLGTPVSAVNLPCRSLTTWKPSRWMMNFTVALPRSSLLARFLFFIYQCVFANFISS